MRLRFGIPSCTSPGSGCRKGVDAGHRQVTGETLANVPVASREITEQATRADPRGVPACVAHAGPKRCRSFERFRLLEERQRRSHDHLPEGGKA